MASSLTKQTRVTGVEVSRSAKLNLGNYENTDVTVRLTAELGEDDTASDVAKDLIKVADGLLRDKVDEIELGQIKSKSKAGRFGA